MVTNMQVQVYEAQIRVLASFHNLRQSRENGVVSFRDLLEDTKTIAPHVYNLFQRCKPENNEEFGSNELRQLFDGYIQKGLFAEVKPGCLKETCGGFVERVLMAEAGSIMPMDFNNKEDRSVFLVAILSHLLSSTKPDSNEAFTPDEILTDLKGETSEQFREGFGFELSVYILEQILTEAVQMGFIKKDDSGKYKLASTKKIQKFLNQEFLKEEKRRKTFRPPAS